MLDTGQLSQVIAHAMSPAFLLGALAGFVALLTARVNGIIDRTRTINAIREDDTAPAHLKVDLPRLQRRAKLVNDAILSCSRCEAPAGGRPRRVCVSLMSEKV